MGLAETMLHFFENAREGSKFNIMSQSFEYRAWNPEGKFYKKLTELLEEGNVEIYLFGGMPQQEKYKKGLEELYNRGAKISILEEPPIAHLSMYTPPNKRDLAPSNLRGKIEKALYTINPVFNYDSDTYILFESEHDINSNYARAKRIIRTKKLSEENINYLHSRTYGIAWTKKPSDENINYANEYFDKLREEGIPYEQVRIQ
ncbi:MAG: hypothetical protein KAT28_01020 [Candidatus Aenigmarchaeota archaeon]|nr:hypothetical protein [Candidatus Aenigmarchaeota archaeon]